MLQENIKNIHKEFDFSKKMIFTDEDRREFKEATHRRICKRSFDIGKDKVRDHCNFTGKYCGAAHYKCNRQFKKPKFTPVILIVVVGSYINKEGPREVKVRNELRFIDSFKFMASFLGKLVSNLSHESRGLGLKETKLKET